MNQKNLNYEIETRPTEHHRTGRAHRPMNQKNLNYEIETTLNRPCIVCIRPMNQKNLNYEIETYGKASNPSARGGYESKESQL